MPQLLVLDATPIIHLAKTRLHLLLGKVDVALLTTVIVKEEVLKGEYEEKSLISGLFEERIKVEHARSAPKALGLHSGEASAIALAKEKGCPLVSDDRVARANAKALGVPVLHTPHLIFRALSKKAVTGKEAERLLQELVESGWWCDAETLARIHSKIRELAK